MKTSAWQKAALIALGLGGSVLAAGYATMWALQRDASRVPTRDESATGEELERSHIVLDVQGWVQVSGSGYGMTFRQAITAHDLKIVPTRFFPDADGDEFYREDFLSPTDGKPSCPAFGYAVTDDLTAYYADGEQSNTQAWCVGSATRECHRNAWGFESCTGTDDTGVMRLWHVRFHHPEHGFGTYEYRGSTTTGDVEYCGFLQKCWTWHVEHVVWPFHVKEDGAFWGFA